MVVKSGLVERRGSSTVVEVTHKFKYIMDGSRV